MPEETNESGFFFFFYKAFFFKFQFFLFLFIIFVLTFVLVFWFVFAHLIIKTERVGKTGRDLADIIPFLHG